MNHEKRRRSGAGVLCLGAGLLVVGLALAGCGLLGSQVGPAITIAGSTSVQPFAEKLAEIYMHRHPQTRLDVQGGGSSAGIYAVSHGACDLAASSRELAAAEKHLVEIPLAYDGIAVIVHPANPLNSLRLEDLRAVFAGKIINWQSLGIFSHAIHAITREEGSGTREAFEHLVMGTVEITPGALVQDSNGSVREIVAGDPHALGYISAGLVDHRVKALAIDGIAPSPENIKNRTYKLVRRFLLVARTAPAGPVKDFVDFVLGPDGQKLLEAEGLVGVTP